MSRKWLSNAEIHRGTGISQPTTRKHIAMDDFSSQVSRAQGHPSVLDLYKPFVDSILMEDRRAHAHRRQESLHIRRGPAPYARLLESASAAAAPIRQTPAAVAARAPRPPALGMETFG